MAYQGKRGLPADGFVSITLLETLRAETQDLVIDNFDVLPATGAGTPSGPGNG
jgi:hypothetical protein